MKNNLIKLVHGSREDVYLTGEPQITFFKVFYKRYTNFSNDPFTDVNQLAQKFDFNCINLGCGYYQQHRDTEYVVIDEVKKSLHMGIKLIHHLGINDYKRNDIEEVEEIKEDDSWFKYLENDYDIVSDKIVDSVIDMYEDGFNPEDIKMYISDLLEIESYG